MPDVNLHVELSDADVERIANATVSKLFDAGLFPHAATMPSEWITDGELQAEYRVSASQTYRWRKFKDGPPFAREGRLIRYRRADVEAWFAARKGEMPTTNKTRSRDEGKKHGGERQRAGK